ncbi:MAG: hypothetical protein PCFJNLEI_02291 [Verrucomicrobiae bacterium]|nr:hypothetical protein [Verrucomicrobiae bacterium]
MAPLMALTKPQDRVRVPTVAVTLPRQLMFADTTKYFEVANVAMAVPAEDAEGVSARSRHTTLRWGRPTWVGIGTTGGIAGFECGGPW